MVSPIAEIEAAVAAELRALLGIGEDVPDADVLRAAEEYATRAKAAIEADHARRAEAMRSKLTSATRQAGRSAAGRIAALGLPARGSPEYCAALGIPPRVPLPPFTNRAARRAFEAKLRAWMELEEAGLQRYERKIERGRTVEEDAPR